MNSTERGAIALIHVVEVVKIETLRIAKFTPQVVSLGVA